MQIRKLIVSSFKKTIRYDSCADQGIFVRCVCVCVCVCWGGGGPGPHLAYEKKLCRELFFFIIISLVLNLFYRSPVVSIICQGSSGGGTFFQGGVQLFTGGSNCFFPYRNPYNL